MINRAWLVLMVVGFVGIIPQSYTRAETKYDIEFAYDATLEPDGNLYFADNVASAYKILSFAWDINTGEKPKFWQRSAEAVFKGYAGLIGTMVLHEGSGHYNTAKESGYSDPEIDFQLPGFGISTTTVVSSEFSEEWRAKYYSMGINENNRMADEQIAESMLQQDGILISETIWYFSNQLILIYQNSSLVGGKKDLSEYKKALAEEDKSAQGDLDNDIEFGLYWQAINLLQYSYLGALYLINGSISKAPPAYVNLQSELADAGVIYSATYYQRFAELLFTLRAGYGYDRMENDDMYQLEAGIQDYRLSGKLKTGFLLGYADTKKPALVGKLRLEYTACPDFSIFSEVMGGDGYHRFSYENDEWLRALLGFKFSI